MKNTKPSRDHDIFPNGNIARELLLQCLQTLYVSTESLLNNFDISLKDELNYYYKVNSITTSRQ